MKYDPNSIKSISIVLHATKEDLEQSATYVDRIIALKKSAETLKMLTDYKNVGEQIDEQLSVPSNVTDKRISEYTGRIKTLLIEKIKDIKPLGTLL